jgi:hypothetical protein
MSRLALEAVIGRAILDEEFRLALFADPEAALVEYELTEAEMAALKSVDAESLDGCSNSLGRRFAVTTQSVRKEQGAAYRSTGEQTIPSSHCSA